MPDISCRNASIVQCRQNRSYFFSSLTAIWCSLVHCFDRTISWLQNGSGRLPAALAYNEPFLETRKKMSTTASISLTQLYFRSLLHTQQRQPLPIWACSGGRPARFPKGGALRHGPPHEEPLQQMQRDKRLDAGPRAFADRARGHVICKKADGEVPETSAQVNGAFRGGRRSSFSVCGKAVRRSEGRQTWSHGLPRDFSQVKRRGWHGVFLFFWLAFDTHALRFYSTQSHNMCLDRNRSCSGRGRRTKDRAGLGRECPPKDPPSAKGRGTGMSTTDESFCSEGASKAASMEKGVSDFDQHFALGFVGIVKSVGPASGRGGAAS